MVMYLVRMIDLNRLHAFLRDDMAAGEKGIRDDRLVRVAALVSTLTVVSMFVPFGPVAFVLAACGFGELANVVTARVNATAFSLKLYVAWAVNNLIYTAAFCSLSIILIVQSTAATSIMGLILLIGALSQTLVVGVNSAVLSYLCLIAPITVGWIIALRYVTDLKSEWGVFAGLVILSLYLFMVTYKARAVMRARNEARAQAEAANTARRRFITAISHEIRTPLNGVMGIAELQRAKAETAESIEQADILITTAASMKHLLNDVLDQAKIEAGQMQLTHTRCDIRALARHTVALFQANAQEKHIELRCEFPPDTVPLIVSMDRLRMGQILSNLISNAIKFTSQGSVVVKVRLEVSRRAAALLDIRVCDTGRGMTPEEMALLFQDFTQVDDQQDRAASGSGLGLSISRGLARAMGGDLTVESGFRKGSEFILRVPCERVTEQIRQSVGTSAPPDLTGWRILAADDNATNRYILERFLQETNAEVTMVPGGAEALAAMASQDQDVLFLDIKMPGMDGPAVFDEMQNLPAATVRPKVIALTGQTNENARLSYLRMGMDGYLSKPLTKQRLFAEMGRLGIKAPKPNPPKI